MCNDLKEMTIKETKMYGREELEVLSIVGEGINTRLVDCESIKVWPDEGTKFIYKEEADKVMDAMEARIMELEYESKDKGRKNSELFATNNDLRSRINELEERIKKLEATISKMETTTPPPPTNEST